MSSTTRCGESIASTLRLHKVISFSAEKVLSSHRETHWIAVDATPLERCVSNHVLFTSRMNR